MILTSPSFWLWWPTASAVLCYAVPAGVAWRTGRRSSPRWLWLAFAAHAWVLGAFFSQPAHFGFAPALSVTAWLVLAVYLMECRLYPQLQSHWAWGILGAVAVGLAAFFPGQVLPEQSSPWLPLHGALGLSAYGFFAAAAVHAWLMHRAELHIRQGRSTPGGLPLLTLERLMFGFVMAGFGLLSATLLAGAWFGEHVYGAAGAAWRWDHKRVFAVLSWATFGLLLLGRWRWGWRGKRATRMVGLGALFLLLSYVGSRLVIELLLGRGQ